ncbi:MAG: RrF2 family transcriptional regulator [Calditrichia bacterium]
MKISAQEEYGLRILVRIAQQGNSEGLTIPEISQAEGLSEANVAKLCRILRLADYIKSSRGKSGGYMLNRPAREINLKEILTTLGGRLYDKQYCETHKGISLNCRNKANCCIQPLWEIVQQSVDEVLSNLTLNDLIIQGSYLTINSPKSFSAQSGYSSKT